MAYFNKVCKMTLNRKCANNNRLMGRVCLVSNGDISLSSRMENRRCNTLGRKNKHNRWIYVICYYCYCPRW